MRRNWLVLLLVCLAVVMMAVLPGCRSKTPKDNGDDDDNGTITTVIGKAGEYNFKLADLAWEKVKEPVNASLSEMAQYDADNPNENEIETDPAENEPDFTKVSGGGVYIVDGNSKGNMCIGSIEWSGDGDSVKDGFEGFGEDDAYEMIQNGQINRVFSPNSGYAWTAYCPDWDDAGATLAQIDKYYDGRIKLYGSTDSYKGENADPESTFVEKGAYVYTMFAKEPEEGQSLTIEKELDMTDGSVTIEFTTDGEVAYPAIIKLMIRDGNGDWYLGGAPDEEELPPEEDPEPVEGEEVAEINESFDWTSYGGIVEWNQSSKIRVSDATGFPWTGYSPTGGENNPITSDENWEGRIKFDADDGGTVQGNYVFTIFDTTGGNQANRWVNMSAGTLVVRLDGENGDPFPVQIKILARDGDGNWFLSNVVEAGQWETTYNFADFSWEQVDSAVAGWMNEMEAGDASAYEMITAGVAIPDLTEVTGGGIYIESSSDESIPIAFPLIKWTAGE